MPTPSTHCIDCKQPAPERESEYTLIGAGWRLVQGYNPDGSQKLDLRCPACWARYKQLTGAQSGKWPRVSDPLPGGREPGKS